LELSKKIKNGSDAVSPKTNPLVEHGDVLPYPNKIHSCHQQPDNYLQLLLPGSSPPQNGKLNKVDQIREGQHHEAAGKEAAYNLENQHLPVLESFYTNAYSPQYLQKSSILLLACFSSAQAFTIHLPPISFVLRSKRNELKLSNTPSSVSTKLLISSI
jgi:hypothetical protein